MHRPEGDEFDEAISLVTIELASSDCSASLHSLLAMTIIEKFSFPEHFQHPLRDEESAEDIDARQEHRNKA